MRLKPYLYGYTINPVIVGAVLFVYKLVPFPSECPEDIYEIGIELSVVCYKVKIGVRLYV